MNRSHKSGFLATSKIFDQEGRMKKKKITWSVIFEDFERRHPNLSKRVVRWCSHDYATILIFLDDGNRLTYNYDTKRAVITA